MNQGDKLEVRNQVLEDWESKIGLPPSNPPGTKEELQAMLNWGQAEIEKMSPHQAISASYKLSAFSIYFQRCLNRQRAALSWVKSQIMDIVAERWQEYDKYTKLEARIPLVCNEDSAARELRKAKDTFEQRIERLNELASGIKNLSYVISLVLKHKSGENK